MTDLPWLSLISGLVSGTLVGWSGRPGGILLTAFGVSAAVTLAAGSGTASGFVSAVAMMLVGAGLGTDLTRTSVRRLWRLGLRPILFTLLTVVSGVAIGAAASVVTDLPLPTAILAAAPGGTAAMVATSLAIGAAAEIVVAVHLVRQVAVLVALPILVDATKAVTAKSDASA